MTGVFERDNGPLLLTRSRSATTESDEVNETGQFSVNNADSSSNSDCPLNVQQDGDNVREENRKRWDLNYHEAAIYLQEGENNDKFSAHPGSQEALPAYLITHNMWFYLLDLLASLLICLLALIERPAVFNVPVWIHTSLELIALLVIALELVLRLRWLGPKPYIRHARTMIKTVTLLIMFMESIAVLVRRTSHFRVTRAIRPLFLLDTYYLRAVRRFVRQMIQSLPPIVDMLLLLLFFMLMFSILGFYLFNNVPHDQNFNTIQDSFISLFILLTTANFPDVMLPAYNNTRWAAVFFLIYLSVELYFLMNLFLAVVYDAFSKIEKDKIRKLLLHKRTACCYAFKLLESRQHRGKITIKHFQGLLKYYRPKMSRRNLYLTFKALNTGKTGKLSLPEFIKVYEITALNWKSVRSKEIWSARFRYPCEIVFRGLHRLVTSKPFQFGVYIVIVLNFLWILGDTIYISVRKEDSDNPAEWIHDEITYLWISVAFIILYLIEIVLKILGLGPHLYFSSGWNIFDFVVTVIAGVGVLMELIDEKFYYMLILRPFRLLRLFKLKKRFRDVLGTLFILASRMLSIAVVILVIYYFFAIIAMELFSHYDMRNCCVNSSVESYYSFDNVTGKGGYYYLNTFDNILVSGVTLFELTVVNNWYIIMEGYAIVATQWSRIFFMVFYIVMMVVMTIVVAFILEAFLFRIQYRNAMHGHELDDDAMMKVDVSLSRDEMFLCNHPELPLTTYYMFPQQQRENSVESNNSGNIQNGSSSQSEESPGHMTCYKGERLRSKNDFSLLMYTDQVKEWIKEEELQRRRLVEELQDMSNIMEQTISRDSSPDIEDQPVIFNKPLHTEENVLHLTETPSGENGHDQSAGNLQGAENLYNQNTPQSGENLTPGASGGAGLIDLNTVKPLEDDVIVIVPSDNENVLTHRAKNSSDA